MDTHYKPSLKSRTSISRNTSKKQWSLPLSSVTTKGTAVYYWVRHTGKWAQAHTFLQGGRRGWVQGPQGPQDPQGTLSVHRVQPQHQLRVEDESALLPQSMVSSPSLFSVEPPIVITNCQQLKLRTFAVIGGPVLTSPKAQGHEDMFSSHQGHRVMRTRSHLTKGTGSWGYILTSPKAQGHLWREKRLSVSPGETWGGPGNTGVSSSQTQKTDLNRNPRRASTLHAFYIRKLDFTAFFRNIEKKASALQIILISTWVLCHVHIQTHISHQEWLKVSG